MPLFSENSLLGYPTGSVPRGRLPVPHQHFTRSNSAFTEEALHRMGRVYSPKCHVCGKEENIRHVLRSCTCNSLEELFHRQFRDAGRPVS